MWTPSHVRVTVLRARNLLGKGKNGQNDAFVVIQLKKEKFHTSVRELTLNPDWHEECDLTIPDGRSSLIITVLHRNIIGIDLFLGEVTLPLADFDIYERPKPRWFILESKANKKHKPAKDRGEIEVKLEFIVKDIPQLSTPLPEKKKRTNSLINLASDVGFKLNAKFPTQRLSLKLGKKLKENEELEWSRNSASEEDSSTFSSRQDLNVSKDNFDLDSEPVTPNIESEAKFSQRSQSISVLPITSSQCSPGKHKDSHSEWSKLFGSKFSNPQVQSMEDIRNPNSIAGKKERSGSLSNLRAVPKSQPVPQRRKTEPHSVVSPTDLNENNNDTQNPRKPSRVERRKSNNGNMALKPCYEDEPLLTINNPSKISSDILEAYGALNREELLKTIVAQKLVIENQRNKMKDMENYIDNLLVRVMNAMPKLLQTPISRHATNVKR